MKRYTTYSYLCIAFVVFISASHFGHMHALQSIFGSLYANRKIFVELRPRSNKTLKVVIYIS